MLYFFFIPLNESEISEQASRQVATAEEPKKGCKHARRRNLHSYNVSRDENPQRGNEMDSPSFEGFHAQFDRKLMYDNKNETQLTPI